MSKALTVTQIALLATSYPLQQDTYQIAGDSRKASPMGWDETNILLVHLLSIIAVVKIHASRNFILFQATLEPCFSQRITPRL